MMYIDNLIWVVSQDFSKIFVISSLGHKHYYLITLFDILGKGCFVLFIYSFFLTRKMDARNRKLNFGWMDNNDDLG